MSVYFNVKEHLSISQPRFDPDGCTVPYDLSAIMRGQLAALGALNLLGEGGLYSLHLVADGKAFDITEDRIDETYKAALAAMFDAKTLELTVDYYYESSVGWAMYDLVGPFPLAEYLKEIGRDDLKGIFYSAWHHADSGDGPGQLMAYGEKNGTFYHGEIDYAEVPEIPAGLWDSADTAVVVEPEHFDPEAHPEVVEACKVFMTLSDEVYLVTDGGLDFCLNSISLDSPEKGKRFLEAMTRLKALMPDDFCMMADFVDISGPDPRMMSIKETETGWKILAAQV